MAGEVNNQEEVTNSIKENDDLQLSLESVLEAADRDQNVQLDIVSDFVRNPIQLLQDTYSEDVDNVMLHPLDLQAIYDGRNNFPNHLNDIINQYQRNFLDFLPWSAIVLIPEPTEAEMNAAEGMSEVIPEPAEEEMNVQVVGEVNLTDETQENERNKPIQRDELDKSAWGSIEDLSEPEECSERSSKDAKRSGYFSDDDYPPSKKHCSEMTDCNRN